uniref:DNA (cytosine-5-)-methyltransferase n=1 Tax=Macrostomum lignano TaxID=282301 RepID=A0A1I8F3M0_9PLAT
RLLGLRAGEASVYNVARACCYLEPGSHKFANNESTRRTSQQQQQQRLRQIRIRLIPTPCYTERSDEFMLKYSSRKEEGPSFPLRIRFEDVLQTEDAVATLDSDRLRPGCTFCTASDVKPLRWPRRVLGCGGLSERLHQAGAAVTHCGPSERDPDAAKAFALNHPDLRRPHRRLQPAAPSGHGRRVRDPRDPGQSAPAADFPARPSASCCARPPPVRVQRHEPVQRREASKLKNSLVASFLSYADFYRPDYFLLENVRNFGPLLLSPAASMRCLLAMGYQLGAAILQAGQFGVPQTRRRLIILAAAPGRQFAQFPIAVHSFSPKACAGLALLVGDRRYEPPTSPASGCFSGPLRPITVGDALSDLPVIDSGGASRLDQPAPYGSKPKTHYQLIMRAGRLDNSDKLTDHVTKQLTPLVEARLALIPTCPGADWRDLPNVEPGKCDSQAKQLNTLIPWCLPHTGDRHNHWAGLYGRLDVEGFFSTTVTNPEPMGKQGRVVHPTQNRVVSVRECARSQGFPDAYRFAGDLVARHRQIGNAVPPPLARALGSAAGSGSGALLRIRSNR